MTDKEKIKDLLKTYLQVHAVTYLEFFRKYEGVNDLIAEIETNGIINTLQDN